ncbi:MAG TPA: hypothetical protein VMX13_05085 [Sedimentisphaerales bacterium]|nr:hypothetical protein [Sedimentisphaerales bacterium]
MSSTARILANRLNAEKSTGPRTLEGKAIVAQNPVKHGLHARQALISSDDQAEFDLYRIHLLAELAPHTPMESILAERIIALSWRLRRTARIQNETIDALIADNAASPLAKLTQSLFPKSRVQSQAADSAQTAPAPDLTLGRMAIKDFAHASVLDRLLMYERRMEHSLYKTMLELQRLKLIRQLNPRSETPFDQ